MIWHKVKDKPLPARGHKVLAAWLGRPVEYEVLIHWSDGQWTDVTEEEVDEIPDLWTPIIAPVCADMGSVK